MKLEVGMYVRTNLGIAKIISFKKHYLGNEILLDKEIIDTHEDYYTSCMYDYKFYLEQIIKTSHNIIDLIQVGDIYKKTYPTGLVEIIPINKFEDLYGIKNDIKNGFKLSIITKEQFESMSYKLED